MAHGGIEVAPLQQTARIDAVRDQDQPPRIGGLRQDVLQLLEFLADAALAHHEPVAEGETLAGLRIVDSLVTGRRAQDGVRLELLTRRARAVPLHRLAPLESGLGEFPEPPALRVVAEQVAPVHLAHAQTPGIVEEGRQCVGRYGQAVAQAYRLRRGPAPCRRGGWAGRRGPRRTRATPASPPTMATSINSVTMVVVPVGTT